jgi:hypothetical protein
MSRSLRRNSAVICIENSFGTVSKNNVPFHSTVRYATVYDVGGAPVKEQESLLQQDI